MIDPTLLLAVNNLLAADDSIGRNWMIGISIFVMVVMLVFVVVFFFRTINIIVIVIFSRTFHLSSQHFKNHTDITHTQKT